MRPVSARPMFVQVVPESVDLYTPSPIRSASRIAHASPVPAQTVDGRDSDTASAPIDCTCIESNTGRKVAPLSTDFHTPPDAAPMYQTRLSPGTPLIDATRPPSAGPRSWNRNGSVKGARGGPPPRCAAAKEAPATISPTANNGARRIAEISWRNELRYNTTRVARHKTVARFELPTHTIA